MAAETLTGVRAKSNFPANSHGYGAAGYLVWGTYAVAADTEDGDIFEMCKTPAGFLCLGGWLSAADLDTGTEAIDLDLGWAANGDGSETWKSPWGTEYTNAAASADPDGLGNFGVWTGDAITDLVAAGQNYRPIVLPAPLWFSGVTTIQLEANAAAGTFAAGSVSCTLIGQIHPK